MIDEVVEHAPLERARVFHAHHGEREHALENPRRREHVSGAHLAAILRDGFRILGTVDAKP
jgi:hypothetical protein